MAPPCDLPIRFATPEAPVAAPSELLPAAAPSELLPAAAPSELLPFAAAPSELLPFAAASKACRAATPSDSPSKHLPIEDPTPTTNITMAQHPDGIGKMESASAPQGSCSPSPRFAQGELNVREDIRQRIRERNYAHLRNMVFLRRSIPHDHVFQGQFDHVFIDKRWYSIITKNNNCISKTMILTVIARPRFSSDGNCIFDGKIGYFPIVTYRTAKRSSVNRPAGIIEMKPIDPVEEEVIRDFMIEKVLPAIHAKWPPEDANKPIFILQNSVEPNLAPDDKLFCEAAKQDGFDMRLVCRPTNSPNFNLLGLVVLNSIQSVQYKTVEELVAVVHQAFEGYAVLQANRILYSVPV